MTGFHLLDEKLSWQGSTEESKFPLAVLPTARMTAVTCSGGHVLGGLFVLFRPVAVGAFSAGLADASWHLGLTTHDEGWLGPADATEYLPSERSLLGPMHFSAILPDTYKLMPGQTYELYFIQHPGLARARKIADEIASGKHEYGDPKRIEVGRGELVVPEDSSSFIPKGGELYKGFVLYRDMARAQCPGASKQVQRLQAHLGALRYLIGSSNFPYLPDVGTDGDKSGGVNDGLIDVRTMGAIFRFQQDASAGAAFKVHGDPHKAYVDAAYDPVADRAKVTALHAEAKARRKVKAPGKKAPEPEKDAYKAGQAVLRRLEQEAAAEKAEVDKVESVANSWAYLAGEAITRKVPHTFAADGVVEAETSAAIKIWLDEKLRKPGVILVKTEDPRTWGNWLRDDAAMAFTAWNELAKTMGFHYGVCVNHTFRSALVDIGHAGYGRSARSIHKTGAAIDVGMTKFSQTVEAFPVIYEHEPDKDRVWFRLLGPASQPVSSEPGAAAACAAPLVAKLEAYAAAEDPLPHAFDRLRPLAVTLASAASSNPAKLFADYYRTSAKRWNYDAFHPEGGTAGEAVSADEEAAERVKKHDQRIAELQAEEEALGKKIDAPKDPNEVPKLRKELQKTREGIAHEEAEREKAAKHKGSFLDLTKLASACGLDRIHAFKSGWAEATKSVKAADLPNLAKLLEDAATSLAEHPTMKDVVTLSRKKQTHVTSVAAIDRAFVSSWADALKSLKKEAPKSVKVSSPQLVVTLSHTADKKADASKIAAKLREMGAKKLAGLVRSDGTPPVQTASEWAQYVDDRVKSLEESWKAMQTAPADAKDKKTAKVSSRKPLAPQSVLMLQPIFSRDFKLESGADVKDAVWFLPGDLVNLPAAGQPIGMEWWHFQFRPALLEARPVVDPVTKKSRGRRLWGDLLEELGYEREVLRHGSSATLHDREGIGYPDADLDDAQA